MFPNSTSTALCSVLLALASTAAHGQTFPAKPIRVISTYVAGSPADGLLRQLSQKMSESVGQPVIVEVQSGAGGLVGAQAVMRAAPDGYTVLATIPTTLVATPLLMKSRPFDPLKDFTPITAALDAAISMVVAANVPANSVKELIEHVRANPGKLAYGSNGVGGTYHMEMEIVLSSQNLRMTHVPYKGGSEALLAVATGQIAVAFAPLSAALPHAKAGKMKVLAMMHVQRFAGAPDIPAIKEQVPEYEKTPTGTYYYGPAGMPRDVLQRLYTEIAKAVRSPEVMERLNRIMFFPVLNTPEEFVAQTRRDIEISARAIKAAGLKPE
jgi:tripartite-type tricarboxylate transporter receptor subunit TctC